MNNYERYLSKEMLANYSGVSTMEIEAYSDVGLLPTAEGAALFHPNAIDVMRFVRRALAVGFEVKEIRSMLHLIEICGGSNAFVITVVREKREHLRRRMVRLAARERTIGRFSHLCHYGRSQRSEGIADLLDTAADERRGTLRALCIELLAQERALERFESALHDGTGMVCPSLLATRPQSSAGVPAV